MIPLLFEFRGALTALALVLCGVLVLVSVNLGIPGQSLLQSLRFHIAAEGGWDAGGATGCLMAAGLIWMGAPLSAAIAAALIGTAAAFVLLRKVYGAAQPAALQMT